MNRQPGIKKKAKQEKKPQTFEEKLVSWIKTIVSAIIIVMFINGALVANFVVPTGSMENTVLPGDFLVVNRFIYGPSTPQIIPFLNTPLPFIKLPPLKQVKRGDVIVFIFPGYRDQVEPDEFQYYLKRCVALGGDTILIRNKKLYINGKFVPLPPHGKIDPRLPAPPGDEFRTFPPGMGFTRDNYGPLVVPKAGDTIRISVQNIRQWNIFIQREGHSVAVQNGTVLIDGKPADFYVVERDYCFAMGDNRDQSLDSRYWGFVPIDNIVGEPVFVYWSWDTNLPSIFQKFSTIRWHRIGTIIE